MSLLDSMKNIGLSSTTVKVKRATDDDEHHGPSSSLMNEIFILTYSPATLKEITHVIKKRLVNSYNNKRNPKKRIVQLLKTFTLLSYLISNGSDEFVNWMENNLALISSYQSFNAYLEDTSHSTNDSPYQAMVNQIQSMSIKLTEMLKDPNLLHIRRQDLIVFRTSVSTPGRKSTESAVEDSHYRYDYRTPLSTISTSPVNSYAQHSYIVSDRNSNFQQKEVLCSALPVPVASASDLNNRLRRSYECTNRVHKRLLPVSEEGPFNDEYP